MSQSASDILQAQVNAAVQHILDDYKPRKIRANKVIRDTAFGFNLFYKYEINLLDSPLLQRLRQIHQTALACYTYPSAVHTRFEHSLGVTVVAQRMIEALRQRDPTLLSDATPRAEVRLAALLHDIGHGPFSHSSEHVYGSFDEIKQVKSENPLLFDRRDPHEILSYFIINSDEFQNLWKKIVELYTTYDVTEVHLPLIELRNVALMILGHHSNSAMNFLAQIVNGPHDADKFDYITRDGYFTGLRTAIDIDRFLLALSTHEGDLSHDTHPGDHTDGRQLCVDVSGVTALEQLLFNKMQLYSSVYHHHKIRAAHQLLVSIIETLKTKGLPLADGIPTSNPSDFLKVDDNAIMCNKTSNADIDRAIKQLAKRVLPVRALVLCSDSAADDITRFRISRLGEDKHRVNELSADISSASGVNASEIFIDFPEAPRFQGTAFGSFVRTSPEDVIRLNVIYPVHGWVKGHAEHRYRAYIFTSLGNEEKVAKAAHEVLQTKDGIQLNKMAFYLANHTQAFVASLNLSIA
ncbi:HD domain-containing protein [Chloroflexota bacterium]